MNALRHHARALVLSLSLASPLLLGGCATTATTGGTATQSGSPADPFESWNRKVYAFNDAIDKAVLEPVAKAYRDVVPSPVRTGVSNVLGNIGDVWSAANHLLQGKVKDGLDMTMRVLTNTLFGLGGLLDPASEMGLARKSEDFGQTLGKWGVGSGPYLMLPLFGPSTLRDTAGLLVDRQADATQLTGVDSKRYAITAVSVLDLRTRLLGATALLDQVALDRYTFVRDAYLSRRLDALYDGAPPLEDPGADPEPAATPGTPPSKKP